MLLIAWSEKSWPLISPSGMQLIVWCPGAPAYPENNLFRTCTSRNHCDEVGMGDPMDMHCTLTMHSNWIQEICCGCWKETARGRCRYLHLSKVENDSSRSVSSLARIDRLESSSRHSSATSWSQIAGNEEYLLTKDVTVRDSGTRSICATSKWSRLPQSAISSRREANAGMMACFL